MMKKKNELEFQDEETEYRSDRTIIVRDFEPDEILKFIEKETGIDKIMCHVKTIKIQKL